MNKDSNYTIEFRDNHLLALLVGPQDKNLLRLEQRLGVTIALRGNKLTIVGREPEATYAKNTVQLLYKQISNGQAIAIPEIDDAIRVVMHNESLHALENDAGHPLGECAPGEPGSASDVSISTKRRIVFPRTGGQGRYIKSMQKNEMVFGIGPAGTGKTYLAVAYGISLLLEGKVDRIILSRPAVEAGEHLGFLPGDLKEKIDPYLRPLYDALNDMLPPEQVLKRVASGEIEVAPLAFMRGRTLANSFVILDEAQNTTSVQMKMFLTRLGPNSRMVITGDLTQIDLPTGATSGLKEVLRVLDGVDGINMIHFDETDVVRHSLVTKIVHAYDTYCHPAH
ncbi:MAG: PhoH family protein [Alphaproteobacteria bacterium]|nr:PhoH family protein [Alphaproteobacteria bacterium]